MLTRSDLQEKVGVTRKMLRIYEEQGLLQPKIMPNGRAVYDESAVERTKFIVALRDVGISLPVIHRLLDPVTCLDGFLLGTVSAKLSRTARQALAAIDLIEAHSKKATSEVFKTSYGDFWCVGIEDEVKKDAVVGFVSSSMETFREAGFDVTSLAVSYTDDREDKVRVRAFKPCATDHQTKDTTYRKYFLPEKTYFAIRTQGFYGNYHCFDGEYEKIEKVRNTTSAKHTDDTTIEVYTKYPINAAPGQAFEALILA